MKSVTVEKKESIFKKLINSISKSAIFNILVNPDAGVYSETQESEKEDKYSIAFKQADSKLKSSLESISTLEDSSKSKRKKEKNSWEIDKDELASVEELTSEKLTSNSKTKQPKKVKKSEDREIVD